MIHKRQGVLTAAGALVTGVCLITLYRSLDGEAVAALRRANVSLLAVSLLFGAVSLAVRTQRWRALLLESAHLPFPQAFWTCAAGQMLNTLLPARMGDAFRGVAAATASSRAFSLGTIVVERVLDTGVVVLAALWALASAPAVSAWMRPSVILLSCAVAVALAGLLALPILERRIVAAVRAWRPAYADFLAELFDGMKLVAKPVTVAVFLAYSFLAWGLDALGVKFAAEACGATLGVGMSILLVTALAFASAIPATGSIGLIPLACAFVLPSFGVSKGVALAVGIVLQSLNLLLTAVTGALGLWLLRYRQGQPNNNQAHLREEAA